MSAASTDRMNRLLRGLPEPGGDDAPDDIQPQTGRDWFDRVVLGRKHEETENRRDDG